MFTKVRDNFTGFCLIKLPSLSISRSIDGSIDSYLFIDCDRDQDDTRTSFTGKLLHVRSIRFSSLDTFVHYTCARV